MYVPPQSSSWQPCVVSFHYPVCTGEIGPCLLHIWQGKRPVADYAIEFHTLAAVSDWHSATLMVAFLQGISEELKDELTPCDPIFPLRT